MDCMYCPYIKDQISVISDEDTISSCFCLKTGKPIAEVRCYEVDKIKEDRSKTKKKRLSGRARNKRFKQHLKYLEAINQNWPPAVMHITEEYIVGKGYVPIKKSYYKRMYKGKSYSSLKKMSNQYIRRYKEDLPNKGNCHKKLYELWHSYI